MVGVKIGAGLSAWRRPPAGGDPPAPGYTPENADNGGAAYLTTPSIGGQSDTPQMLLFAAATLNAAANALADDYLIVGLGASQSVNCLCRTATGSIQCIWRNAVNGDEANVETIGTVGAEFVAVLASIDTTRTVNSHLLAVRSGDGWETTTQARVNASANLEGTPSGGWSVCARPDGFVSDMVMHRAAVWQGVAPAVLSASVQSLFVTASGALVDPAVSAAALGAPLFDIHTGWNSDPGPFTTSGAFAVT